MAALETSISSLTELSSDCREVAPLVNDKVELTKRQNIAVPIVTESKDCKRIRMDESTCYNSNVCGECSAKFDTSFLCKNFSVTVCDECKDIDEKYKLITATQVRQSYLLTDRHMIDDSTRKLSFIEKRNPRNSGWSRMKLFLECQVREKAFLVWGGQEGIEKEGKRRRELSHNIKRNKYKKELKKLRSSLKIASASFRPVSHEHSYGLEELVDSETDKYTKECTVCGYTLVYEKL